jgi:ankyrin repeat protein
MARADDFPILNRSRFMRGRKSSKRFAGRAVALFLLAGRSQFPSSSPQTVRAGDQREAKPIAADLVTAIRNADALVVCKLLDNGADVNARDAEGNTPLILAARRAGNSRTVQLLLERGANAKEGNDADISPALAGAAGAGIEQAPPSYHRSPQYKCRKMCRKSIKPLLERSCVACHRGEKPLGHFRLDGQAAILKGGASGAAAIVPGHSEKSLLIDYVSDKVPESEMPPKVVRKRFPALTTDEVALLRAWIDQGAEWPAGVLLTAPKIAKQR